SRSTAQKSYQCSCRGSALAPPCRLARLFTAGWTPGAAAHQSSAELPEQRLDETQPALPHRNPTLDHRLDHVGGDTLCHQLLDPAQIDIVQGFQVGQAKKPPRFLGGAVHLDIEFHAPSPPRPGCW